MNGGDTDSDIDPLSRLAIWYGSDKALRTGHGYTPYYHEILGGRRKTTRKVLEVGIDRGASLIMWRAYFPWAEIYALDVEPSKLLQGIRIRSFLCNQAVEDDLRAAAEWAGGDFDFIVDDGSHVPAHQILTARMLVPLLASGGIYVVEDVLNPEAIVPHIPYPCEVVPFDLMRDPYSNLVVIRRSAELS